MRSRIFLAFLLFTISAQAQKYPQGYFRNPLDIPISLAGNFGECRPNHFHSGIDIKTESKENFRVHAAADGYISRIKIQNGGFGHALYIQHPNGYTTLYAHLNNFAPELQKYLRSEQHRRKSWAVDLYLPASKFPVKKGDFIAYSGNTGGSTAPHLHFEIRNNKGHPVNPLLFGFKIKDNIAPKPYKVVFYNLTKSTYRQEPITRIPRKKGNNYVLDSVIMGSNIVGIGVDIFDYMNGSNNTLNFSTAELLMDGELQCKINLDDIGYDVTRYLHAYADHKYKKETGRWVQQFFLLPGNKLTHIYENLNKMKGALDIDDRAPHHVSIKLHDANNNTTTISFYIRFSGKHTSRPTCDNGQVFKVNQVNSFTHPNVKFTLGTEDLYDDVCFTMSEKEDLDAYSARYQLSDETIPIHTYFSLYIKPNKPVPFELRDKIAMVYSVDGKDEYGKDAVFDNGWYRASVRTFGEYRLIQDTNPPQIIPMQSRTALLTSDRITFKAKEDITSVVKFEAKIDDEWVPFEQNGDIFYYEFEEGFKKGDHEVVLSATDENGNTESIIYTFKR